MTLRTLIPSTEVFMISRRSIISFAAAGGLTLVTQLSGASTIYHPFSIKLAWSNLGIIPMYFGGFRLGGTYDFGFTVQPTNSTFQNPPYRCDLYFALSTPKGWFSWVEPSDASADFMTLVAGLRPARANYDLDYSADRNSDQIFDKRTRVQIPDTEGFEGLYMLICACVDPGKDPVDTDNWYQSAIKAFTVRAKEYNRN